MAARGVVCFFPLIYDVSSYLCFLIHGDCTESEMENICMFVFKPSQDFVSLFLLSTGKITGSSVVFILNHNP